MPRSILTRKGLRKLVEFVVGAFVDSLQALLAVSEKGHGETRVLLNLTGDFTEDRNGNLTFSGSVSAPIAASTGVIDASAGAEYVREVERSADAAVRIEIEVSARVD